MGRISLAALVIATGSFVAACARDTASDAVERVNGNICVIRHLDKAGAKGERLEVPAPNGRSLEVETADEAKIDDRGCYMEHGLKQPAKSRASDAAADLNQNGIAFTKAYSSFKCRTAQTAYLVSGLVADATIGTGNNAPTMAKIRDIKTAANAGNVLVVLHSNQINRFVNELAGGPDWQQYQCYGEVRCFQKGNGGNWIANGEMTTAVTIKSDGKTCHQ